MNAHIHSLMMRLNGCLHVDNKYVAEFLQSIILDVKHENNAQHFCLRTEFFRLN
mgnify:CR=1 FL=1